MSVTLTAERATSFGPTHRTQIGGNGSASGRLGRTSESMSAYPMAVRSDRPVAAADWPEFFAPPLERHLMAVRTECCQPGKHHHRLP